MILLCPKTSFALLGTGHAKFKDYLIDSGTHYGEACIQMVGKAKFAARCVSKMWVTSWKVEFLKNCS